jgi:hypothetical protein
MDVLQSASTAELIKELVAVYSAASHLSTFERCAVLRWIETELSDRVAARQSGFRVSSQVEQLQLRIEEQENQLFHLRLEIAALEAESTALEAELEEAKKNGGPPTK